MMKHQKEKKNVFFSTFHYTNLRDMREICLPDEKWITFLWHLPGKEKKNKINKKGHRRAPFFWNNFFFFFKFFLNIYSMVVI